MKVLNTTRTSVLGIVGGLAWTFALSGSAMAQQEDAEPLISQEAFAALQESLTYEALPPSDVMALASVVPQSLLWYGLEALSGEGFALVLADDGSKATLALPFDDQDEVLFDGEPSSSIVVEFTPYSEGVYSFAVTGLPKRLSPADPDLADGGEHIALGDTVLTGRWNVAIGVVEHLYADVGTIEMIFGEGVGRFDGAEMYFGALSEYPKPHSFDVSGIELSTAQAMVFNVGEWRIQSDAEVEDDAFDLVWDGMEADGLMFLEEGDERPVPNILYGTPEMQEFFQEYQEFAASLMFAGPEIWEEAGAMLEQLFDSLGAYQDVVSTSRTRIHPLNVHQSYDGETQISMKWQGMAMHTASGGVDPSEGGFAIEFYPMVMSDADMGEFRYEGGMLELDYAGMNFASWLARLKRGVLQPGTWGDYFALVTEAFDELSVNWMLGPIRADVHSIIDDGATVSLHFDGADGELALVGVRAAEGATLTQHLSVGGFTGDLESLFIDSLVPYYLDDKDANGRADLLPSTSSITQIARGIPLAAWQEMLDGMERRNAPLDAEAFVEEAEALVPGFLALLAPLIQNPPTVDLRFEVTNDISSITGDSTLDVKPMVSPSFVEGNAVVEIDNYDALLQALISANKRAEIAADDPDAYFSYDEYDMLDGLSALAAMMIKMRDVAQREEGGGSARFEIATDALEMFTLNGIGAERLAEMLDLD